MRVFSTRILAKILRNLYIFTWLTKTLICSHVTVVTSKKFFEFFEYLRMALQGSEPRSVKPIAQGRELGESWERAGREEAAAPCDDDVVYWH